MRRIFVPLILTLLALRTANPAAATDVASEPTTYHQAPEWKALVEQGKLPPVNERLPQTPMVIRRGQSIGRYGGVWRRAHLGPKDASGMGYLVRETLLTMSPDYQEIVPNVCRSYEISDDGRVFTFHLRPGMKWSDGALFGADDFLFFYNCVLADRRISPVFSSLFKRGDEPMRMRKIDDLTIEFSFAEPYPFFIDYIAGYWNPCFYLPKHYLKQYHPNFVPVEDLERKAAEGGYLDWRDQFAYKRNAFRNIDMPTIHAWLPQNLDTSQLWRWKRNPYFWKVDPEGNQLPYINEIHVSLISDPESLLLKARAGEIDMQMRRIGGINVVGIANYPFLMEAREEQGYRLVLRDIFRQNKFSVLFNFSHPDPVLRDLFLDFRFRRALSHAMNRQDIVDFCQGGLGRPSQSVPNPKSRWYDEKTSWLYTEYDPALARRLLDEIGLTRWDEEHKFRLRRGVREITEDVVVSKRRVEKVDGKDVDRYTTETATRKRLVPSDDYVPLTLTMESRGPLVEAMEIYREDLAEVGVKMVVRPVESRYWYTMLQAAAYDWTVDSTNTAWDGCPKHSIVVPPFLWYAAPKWHQWDASGGRAGDEPPQWFKDMLGMRDRIIAMPRTPARDAAIRDLIGAMVGRLYYLGGVMAPREATFAIVTNEFMNVPDPLPNLVCVHPSTFYFRDGNNAFELKRAKEAADSR